MKKSLLSAAFVLLGVAALTPAIAQVTVSASINDLQATNFNDYGFPNSYTIDYSPFCTGSMPCSSTQKQLTAMVADDGTTARLLVDDQTSGGLWPMVILPSGGGSAPDVVIGNDFSTPGQYIVGVTAVTGGSLMYYTYSISGVGSGGLSITGPTSTITISSANALPPAHIDIACVSSNPYMGLPNANLVAITWRDATAGIMGNSNQLNGPGAGTTAVINSNLNLSNPDVAYVERSASFNKVAEFAYVDLTTSPNMLYYSEWQTIPSAAPGGATLYDNTKTYYNPYPGMVSVLRIDGIDDYSLNTPGGGNATFCIAAAANAAPLAGKSIFEYNDVTGASVATNITAPVASPSPGIRNNTNEIPVVACGPGSFYSVGFFSNPLSSSGGAKQMYYAISVDWSTGKPTTNKNAYEIMKQSFDPSFDPGLCLSGTCNTNAFGTQNLFAGYDNYAFLLYKYSIPVAPYSFKHAATAMNQTSEWQLSPNPATDHVTLTVPTGFNTGNASYDVTDISGKTLQGGAINDVNQQIGVNNLPSGTYLLNVHMDSKAIKTIKFVKE